ncbi:alpha/beta hydrolase [soil metagenome]
MSLDDFEFQYLTGQARPGFPELHADFAARSVAVVADVPCELDLRYGDAERCTFDYFPVPDGVARGVVAFFHPGYWQWRDKAHFRFIAPTFTALGLDVALVNYPLCPVVTLEALTEAVRGAMHVVAARARQGAGAAVPLIAAGHSAGGHLAAEMGLTPWAERGLPDDGAVAGVIALSGLYDIEPLRHTSLNINLKLDADSARAASPLLRVNAGAPQALIAVGADETPAMRAQTEQMHAAWQAEGNASTLLLSGGADHFSLLNQLTTPGTALHAQVAALVERALGTGR